MKYKKFRDLKVNIFDLKFNNFVVDKIINYMPAGNDVVEIKTTENNNYFIKIERSKVADFKAEYENINKIKRLGYSKAPDIIGFIDKRDLKVLVLNKIHGKRLNEVINDQNKETYLFKLGKELATIHGLNVENFNIAKQRVINEIPYDGLYGKTDDVSQEYINYLQENNYKKEFNTFIHGDFHYANILWNTEDIEGVLDWEYSGKGHKEQDIAWALTPRLNQKFLNNIEDIKVFLKGYKSISNYDNKKLNWCLINSCMHFYLMNNDKSYQETLIKLMSSIIENEF